MSIMTHLVEALRIMDERGRRANDHKSYMLWEKEWNALRHEIIEAVFLVSLPTSRFTLTRKAVAALAKLKHLVRFPGK